MSSAPVQQLKVTFDGSMDLEQLIVAVQTNRAYLLEQQLTINLKEVERVTKDIEELNALMTELSSLAAFFKGDGTKKLSEFPGWEAMRDKVIAAANNASYKPIFDGDFSEANFGNLKLADVDKAIDKLKNVINKKTTIQNLETTNGQNMMTKRNQTWELVSNSVTAMAGPKKNIIGHL